MPTLNTFFEGCASAASGAVRRRPETIAMNECAPLHRWFLPNTVSQSGAIQSAGQPGRVHTGALLDRLRGSLSELGGRERQRNGPTAGGDGQVLPRRYQNTHAVDVAAPVLVHVAAGHESQLDARERLAEPAAVVRGDVAMRDIWLGRMLAEQRLVQEERHRPRGGLLGGGGEKRPLRLLGGQSSRSGMIF